MKCECGESFEGKFCPNCGKVAEIEQSKFEKNKAKDRSTLIIAIVWIAIVAVCIFGIRACVTHFSSNVEGTYKSQNGELLSVEIVQDLGSKCYGAYIATTEQPWCRDYVIVDTRNNEISYPVSSKMIVYELKGKKLTFASDGTSYKKMSKESDADSILSKEKMTADMVVGTYKNADSQYIIIDVAESAGYVNVYVCDSFKNIITEKTVPYTSFFNNQSISVEFSDGTYEIYFDAANLIYCNKYFEGYLKEYNFPASVSKKESSSDTELPSELTVEMIKTCSEGLIVAGANMLANEMAETIEEIEDFYVDFTITNKTSNIDDVTATVLYSYTYDCPEAGGYDWAQYVVEGKLDGTGVKKLNGAEDSDFYHTICQGYNSDFQQLEEQYNYCWYSEIDKKTTRYVYGLWNHSELFEDIVGNAKVVYEESNADSEIANSPEETNQVSDEWIWFNDLDLFYCEATNLRIEVAKQGDSSFMMSFEEVYWSENSREMYYLVDIKPDEIGAEGEFIYRGDNTYFVYYPDENYIYVYDGEYTGEYYPY